jgi:hypothetical protein
LVWVEAFILFEVGFLFLFEKNLFSLLAYLFTLFIAFHFSFIFLLIPQLFDEVFVIFLYLILIPRFF